MGSAIVKDTTPDSLTKNKRIAVPVTILECPPMKIVSVRFYKDGVVSTEILSDNLDKELKKKIRVSKKKAKALDSVKDFDDITLIVHTLVKKTGIKKKPDLLELGLSGENNAKLTFAKEHVGKEIHVSDVFEAGQLIDAKGLTTGKGLVGPVKRFGIKLKRAKSEKGRRRPGSLGPWHPARVTFRVPMAGQLGLFTRTIYNNKILGIFKPDEAPLKNVKNYGDVKNDYLLVRGSIQGPAKRALVATVPLRTTKRQSKKAFEFISLSR